MIIFLNSFYKQNTFGKPMDEEFHNKTYFSIKDKGKTFNIIWNVITATKFSLCFSHTSGGIARNNQSLPSSLLL